MENLDMFASQKPVVPIQCNEMNVVARHDNATHDMPLVLKKDAVVSAIHADNNGMHVPPASSPLCGQKKDADRCILEVYREIMDMQDEYDSQQADIDDLSTRIEHLEACYETESDRIDTNDDCLSGLEERLNKVTDKVSILSETLVSARDLDNCIPQLEFEIRQLKFQVESLTSDAAYFRSNHIFLNDEDVRRAFTKVNEGVKAAESVLRFERKMQVFWPVFEEVLKSISLMGSRADRWMNNETIY